MIIPWDKFWNRVEKGLDCWEWTGTKTAKGYGTFAVKGKHYKAHRISYEMHIGEIPEGHSVCHKCDNRGCVNPDHLFSGTDLINMQDKIAKGRGKGPPKILSNFQEFEIARRWKPYQNTIKLSEEFEITPRMVTKIGNQHGKKRGPTGFNCRSGTRWSKS